MKVLHTADTHLGDLTGPTKDGQNLRRLDTLRCMEAIVASAQTEKPDLAIIAGDLFNRSRVWADTALEDVNDAVTHFIRPLCEASSAVVLLFGTENHDNPRAFELLAELTKDARNLYIITTPKVLTLQTTGGPVQIMGVPGFDKGRLRTFCPGIDKETENRNATALINDVVLGLATQLDRAIPAILVAHYTVSGAEADNGSTFLAGQDVVILPATIDATGVDLACFGHIHHPQRLVSNTPAYYCGSPNQLNFNDEGTEHGFYYHDIFTSPVGLPGTAVATRFVNTPERKHYTLHIGPEDVAAFIRSGELNHQYLLYEGSRLCVVTSQNAYDYFSQDDDGHGLERGGLVAAILARLEKRDAGHQHRWDKVWDSPLCLRYKRPDCEDFFIWGYDFYNAPIDDLKAIAEIVGYNPSALDRARR